MTFHDEEWGWDDAMSTSRLKQSRTFEDLKRTIAGWFENAGRESIPELEDPRWFEAGLHRAPAFGYDRGPERRGIADSPPLSQTESDEYIKKYRRSYAPQTFDDLNLMEDVGSLAPSPPQWPPIYSPPPTPSPAAFQVEPAPTYPHLPPPFVSQTTPLAQTSRGGWPPLRDAQMGKYPIQTGAEPDWAAIDKSLSTPSAAPPPAPPALTAGDIPPVIDSPRLRSNLQPRLGASALPDKDTAVAPPARPYHTFHEPGKMTPEPFDRYSKTSLPSLIASLDPYYGFTGPQEGEKAKETVIPPETNWADMPPEQPLPRGQPGIGKGLPAPRLGAPPPTRGPFGGGVDLTPSKDTLEQILDGVLEALTPKDAGAHTRIGPKELAALKGKRIENSHINDFRRDLRALRKNQPPSAYDEYTEDWLKGEVNRQTKNDGPILGPLVTALMGKESSFIASAKSPAATGPMQISHGLSIERGFTAEQVSDPATNIRIAVEFLRESLVEYQGDIEKVLVRYNFGPRWAKAWPNMPKDTSKRGPVAMRKSLGRARAYVTSVMSRYKKGKSFTDYLGPLKLIRP